MRHVLLGGLVLARDHWRNPSGTRTELCRGPRVFRSQCSICHSPQPAEILSVKSLSRRWPPFRNDTDFRYSAANRASGLVWNPPTLDRYLTAPREVVPGTLMSYPGLKDEHARSDLIAYLASLR